VRPREADTEGDLPAIMAALSGKLETILPLFRGVRDIVYLDIPYHENVGDRLIHAGTEAFFRLHRFRIGYRCTLADFDEAALRSALGPDTAIVLHGGGNFGTVWEAHQAFRERIVTRFPERRIVIMPQSVEFDSDAARDASASVFRSHRNLAICVRDRVSETMVRGRFTDEVVLAPDMAHALFGTLRPTSPPIDDRPLVLARRDRESVLASAMPGGIDWMTFLTARDRLVRRALSLCHGRAFRWRALGVLPSPVVFVRADANYLIRKAVRVFSPHAEIHTDRLHALLLACLLGRRVRYLDNSYGKLSRYVETWLADAQTITRATEAMIAHAALPTRDGS
jgi:pyruvyl transferase EpsO